VAAIPHGRVHANVRDVCVGASEPTYAGVPVLDATRFHVEAAIDWLLGGSDL
jgi:hypothetical protein